jgi:hypothetical protein
MKCSEKVKKCLLEIENHLYEERHEDYSSKNEELLTELEAVVIKYITKLELALSNNSKKAFAIYE